MRELSLNVLDIAQNSITAQAGLITIEVIEDTRLNTLAINIIDNGRGMSDEQLMSVRDPFFTTRTTRKVGMGIPLFKLAAEQTGGCFSINSALGKGTSVSAVFKTDSMDFTPLGDMCSTVVMLVTMNTDREFVYRHNRSIAKQSSKLCLISDSLAYNGDYPDGSGLLVHHAECHLVRDYARYGACLCVARDSKHVKPHRAHAGHRLKLLYGKRSGLNRIYHPPVLTYRYKCSGQSAYIRACHDSALLDLIV